MDSLWSLREIKESDLKKIMKWRMDPEITKYMNTDPVLTIEKQKEWHKRIQIDDTSIYRIIESNHVPIGLISIVDIDKSNYKCAWGYYIGEKQYTSLKLAISLELSLYEYCFEILKLNKVYNEVLSFNTGVIKLHQMCGCNIEGKLKQHICKNDEFYDVTVMAIFKEQWKTIKEKIKYQKIEF